MLTKPVNWQIIRFLKKHGKCATTFISDGLGKSVQTIMPNLNDLVKKGLVKKEDGYGRTKLYSLTEEGKKIDYSEEYEALKPRLSKIRLTMPEFQKIKEIMNMAVDDESKLYWINKNVFEERRE